MRSDVAALKDGLKRLDIIAVPTIYINSEKFMGLKPLEFFEKKFDEILASGAAKKPVGK